jgi:hypothetical protein
MFGQTMNNILYNSVILCNVIPLQTIYVVIRYIKFDTTVFDLYVRNIILKLFIKSVLNIRDTNIVAKKYLRLYINLFTFRIYNTVSPK